MGEFRRLLPSALFVDHLWPICELLGLDRNDVTEMTITPDQVSVELFSRNEAGSIEIVRDESGDRAPVMVTKVFTSEDIHALTSADRLVNKS
jgi:hypothetical protein